LYKLKKLKKIILILENTVPILTKYLEKVGFIQYLNKGPQVGD